MSFSCAAADDQRLYVQFGRQTLSFTAAMSSDMFCPETSIEVSKRRPCILDVWCVFEGSLTVKFCFF